jgi:glutaredoxin
VSPLIVYVLNNCEACDAVVAHIREEELDCAIINISDVSNSESEKAGMIFPALFDDEILKAYGVQDIIKYLDKRPAST